MLMCALQDAGACLRNPPIYARSGIPGSGGPDWLRSDYEWIVCATREQGRLPWSDNTACGKPPKFDPGGNMTHRTKDGKRVRSANHKGKAIKSGPGSGRARKYDGTPEKQPYIPPKVANPGNIIRCSGGHLGPGGDYAHSGNEAPFPFALPQFFVKSFCPPGGIVLDPFSGSGTTAHAAYLEGRHYVGIDVRESQIELARERLAAAEAERKTRLF